MIWASGHSSRIPSAIFSTAHVLEIEPLNESGAMTIFIWHLPFHFN
jgi:hypothetical protein